MDVVLVLAIVVAAVLAFVIILLVFGLIPLGRRKFGSETGWGTAKLFEFANHELGKKIGEYTYNNKTFIRLDTAPGAIAMRENVDYWYDKDLPDGVYFKSRIYPDGSVDPFTLPPRAKKALEEWKARRAELVLRRSEEEDEIEDSASIALQSSRSIDGDYVESKFKKPKVIAIGKNGKMKLGFEDEEKEGEGNEGNEKIA